MLLDFLRPDGVEAGGKYNLLPIKLINELDLRLSRPLRLKMARPQIKSHPYLHGLNLLLRASGLTRVDGTGLKARLVVDPEMLIQWEQLNPAEQSAGGVAPDWSRADDWRRWSVVGVTVSACN
jgi:hypothetical protein